METPRQSSAKAVFKSAKEFQTARHTLYSAEEDMELDQVVPVVTELVFILRLPAPFFNSIMPGFDEIPELCSRMQGILPGRNHLARTGQNS